MSIEPALVLIILVALAFAQPFWQSALATPQGQAAAVVLIVDSSASARQERDGMRFWHTLQASAERTIGALTPGLDVVNVIEASSNPRPLLPKLTPNLAAAANEVRTLQPTFERADLPRALSLAGEQLARHTGGRRLVILSDLQRSNWAALIDGSPVPLPSGTQVTVVEPSVEPPENVALSAPRAFPPQPLVGQPVQLVVRACRDQHALFVSAVQPGLVDELVSPAGLAQPVVGFARLLGGDDGAGPDCGGDERQPQQDRPPWVLRAPARSTQSHG